jgi:hypothetical protein
MLRSTARFASYLFLLSLPVLTRAQQKKISYTESSQDFTNPERGFYIPLETKASRFTPLDENRLMDYRLTPQKQRRATYAVRVSIIMRSYELDTFKNKSLSPEFLADIQKDFDIIRKAGLKMVLRFAYTNRSHGGDCKDASHICPLYGDAPERIVLEHIQQLKPLFQQNADVIAALQEGFIGIWGENYFTDYFGDASANGDGKVLDSGWVHRNEVLKALLNALPDSRMIQVRTPQIKQKFVYGPSAPLNSAALTPMVGFSRSDASRIGFHNDCFLASADDYGTFADYGSSSQEKQPAAKDILRKFIEADTKFTVVGGETCDDAFSPQNDCSPAGYAEQEMRDMHYSFLNSGYNNNVNNDWDSGGCMESIKRKLGYRFVLRHGVFPAKVKKTADFKFQLVLDNIGFASPYNPRKVELVLRNKQDKKEYTIVLPDNPQFWFTGSHEINAAVKLPSDLVPGNYELFLSLPDASPSISKRPEYAIQLANENTWEESTGYNNLQDAVTVE